MKTTTTTRGEEDATAVRVYRVCLYRVIAAARAQRRAALTDASVRAADAARDRGARAGETGMRDDMLAYNAYY